MGDGIGALLSPGSLRNRADGRTFERGEDYAIAGKVLDLVERDGQITATVRGTHQLARFEEARDEFERAASLTQNLREREFLQRRAAECAALRMAG